MRTPNANHVTSVTRCCEDDAQHDALVALDYEFCRHCCDDDRHVPECAICSFGPPHAAWSIRELANRKSLASPRYLRPTFHDWRGRLAWAAGHPFVLRRRDPESPEHYLIDVWFETAGFVPALACSDEIFGRRDNNPR